MVTMFPAVEPLRIMAPAVFVRLLIVNVWPGPLVNFSNRLPLPAPAETGLEKVKEAPANV